MPSYTELAQELTTRINNMEVMLAQHTERERMASEQIAHVYKYLIVGNGEVSFKERLANHETWINEQKEKAAREEERRWQVKLKAIGEAIAVIFVIVTGILNLVK